MDNRTARFEQIVREHGGRIRRIAMRYSGPGESEDLIQEILLALWRSLPNFRGDARIETWLYRVALNTALSGLRKRHTRQRGDEKVASVYREASGASGVAETDILGSFLDSLGEVDASIMMMTLDGMSPAQIEEVIGTSANAITVRINRMKKKYIETYLD